MSIQPSFEIVMKLGTRSTSPGIIMVARKSPKMKSLPGKTIQEKAYAAREAVTTSSSVVVVATKNVLK